MENTTTNNINTINASISTLPLLLTVNQLAECLCISPSLAYRLCHKKQIRHLHLGKTMRKESAERMQRFYDQLYK